MRRGFTLVELLAVAAVVALLLGLLLPVLARVRTAGQSATCMSNLRQMALAAQTYATTHQHFPPAIRYENDAGFKRVGWDWVTSFSGDVVSAGSLWEHTGDPDRVHQCPAFHGSATASGDPFTGYNYNTTYLGGEAPFPTTGWDHFRPGVTFGMCRRNAKCAMFGDGGWAGGANKFMRAPLDSEGVGLDTVYAGGQAFRHGGTTNVAYVDGHVAAAGTPHRGEHATDARLEQLMGFPANGFLSDDDSAYRPR